MGEKWRLNGFYAKAQLSRWRDQIPLRYSCRAYGDLPSVAQWTTLSYAAARVCLPGVRILLAACDESFFVPAFLQYGRIRGAQRFAAIVADQAVPEALLHAGISGEAFVLEATSCGVNTCWVGGTYKKKESPVLLGESEALAAVIPLGIAANPVELPVKRMRKPIAWIASGIKDWPEEAQEAARAVHAAPSAMNMQPWKLRMGAQSMALYADSQAMSTGIALLHMEAALCDVPRLWMLEPEEKGSPVAKVRLNRQSIKE